VINGVSDIRIRHLRYLYLHIPDTHFGGFHKTSYLKNSNVKAQSPNFEIWILEFEFSVYLVVAERCEMFWQMRKVFLRRLKTKMKDIKGFGY
jgi:hypothetical protein